jgi:serine protease Do
MLLGRFIVVAAITVTSPGVWGQARNVISKAPLPQSSFLGIQIWPVDSVRAKELKLPDASGVQVTLVIPNSPAEAAGIKTGDVITEYNGQKVEDGDQFSRLVRETQAGRQVRLRVVRNGSAQVLIAKIGTLSGDLPNPVPRNELPIAPATPDVPRSLMTWRNPVLGFDAEPLFGQLATYFGVNEGVLVRSVANGSLAAQAGLKAGDVITMVGKAGVSTPAEITARLRMVTTPSVRITIVRERSEQTLTLSLE